MPVVFDMPKNPFTMTHPLLAPALAAALWLAAGAAHAVTCENNIPPSNPDSVYRVDTTHLDGTTVTDTRTGLMWKQCLEGYGGTNCGTTVSDSQNRFTWANALAHAEGHTFAGHSDWRLPNLKELRSLVEECRIQPAINDAVFPNTPPSVVWSGSPLAGNPSGAWYVGFNGGSASYSNRNGDNLVRLVRGGQSLAPLPALSALALSGTPTASGAAVAGTSNLAGTGYWVVVPQGGAAPTPAQVKAQAAYGGVTLSAHGSASMALNTQQTFAVSSLAASTAYDFYLVVQSEPNGPLSVLRKVSFNTAALTYAITATASPTLGGAVSCSPSTVTPGGSSTCTATANADYRFHAWTGACASHTTASCTLNNIQTAQTATAVFAHEITVQEGQQQGRPIVVSPPTPSDWAIADVSARRTNSIATPPPSTVELPYGVVSLQLTGGATASTATVVLTYPQPLPAGTTYYKFGKTQANPTDHWYEFGGAVISGNTITLTLADGGAGDSDLLENGEISDPGGPALRTLPTAAQPIPTLSEWAMLLLAGLLGLLAAAAMRRSKA